MNVHRWNLTKAEVGKTLVCNTTPFLEGRTAGLMVSRSVGATGTINFEYSNDGGATWTNYLQAAELGELGADDNPATQIFQITLGGQVRPNVSAYTDGEFNFALMAGA